MEEDVTHYEIPEEYDYPLEGKLYRRIEGWYKSRQMLMIIGCFCYVTHQFFPYQIFLRLTYTCIFVTAFSFVFMIIYLIKDLLYGMKDYIVSTNEAYFDWS